MGDLVRKSEARFPQHDFSRNCLVHRWTQEDSLSLRERLDFHSQSLTAASTGEKILQSDQHNRIDRLWPNKSFKKRMLRSMRWIPWKWSPRSFAPFWERKESWRSTKRKSIDHDEFFWCVLRKKEFHPTESTKINPPWWVALDAKKWRIPDDWLNENEFVRMGIPMK